MSECFVIQPFDNDKFDKRYVDTFEPAIKNAGLEPYRVDKDLAVNDLVEGIKDGIDRASAVLADLTTDNPNVWYELGHAIARGKPFCLICSDERQGEYPFDIGHLKVVPYKTGSLSDFEKLATDISDRLRAVHTKGEQLKALSTAVESIPSKDGLDPFEQVALSLIFEQHLDSGITTWNLKQQMERAGFTKAATTLGVINLTKKGFVKKDKAEQDNGEPYDVFAMTDDGIEWVRSHPADLVLSTRRTKNTNNPSNSIEITDDDIPF